MLMCLWYYPICILSCSTLYMIHMLTQRGKLFITLLMCGVSKLSLRSPGEPFIQGSAKASLIHNPTTFKCYMAFYDMPKSCHMSHYMAVYYPLIIPRPTEGGMGVYWIHPKVCPSVRPPVCRQDFRNFLKNTIGSIHFIPGIYPYGVSLLTPIHFRVPNLIFGPLVATYMAENGVSGTF